MVLFGFEHNQRLRFIGKDGSMGLEHGRVYEVKLFVQRGWLWVRWYPNWPFPTSGEPPCACPYETTQAFANNWSTLRKGEV